MKKAKLFMMLALLVMGVSNVFAQNVTIRPTNGSMICALTNTQGTTSQLGFQLGAFGTWKHNQLSLTMTGSNSNRLTDEGQLSEHANHFITGDKCTFNPALSNSNDAKNYIVADWGGDNLRTGYITIALPKGYRFTGYTFMVSHDVSMFGQNNTAFTLTTNTDVYMSETDNEFNNVNTITLAGQSSEVKTLTRTGDDMGNVLYFKTYANRNGFYAVTFRYIELTFTADADANVDVVPSGQQTSGTSMLEIPFNTGKVDFGNITPGTYQGATRVSYQYQSVTDMPANMLLYEEESVHDGTGFDGTSGKVAYQKSGSITTSGEYFKFTADNKEENADRQVYFLETPVSAKMKNNKETPVQFRIVGATLNYTDDPSGAQSFYITYTTGGTKYYMNLTGSFTTTPTTWSIDEEGYVSSGSDYLYVSGGSPAYTNKRNAHKFTIDETGIKCISGRTYNNVYLSVVDYTSYGYDIEGYFINSEYYSKATIESISSGDAHKPATLYVYDKEGDNPQEITVDGSGSVDLTDFNNDAIKFAVKNGDAVYMNFVLKVQALSPYIDRMSVVMNDTDNGKNLQMKQRFTSDDFSVGGDEFHFYLPTGCEGDDITITFEDLYSKYGDETYDHISNTDPGNSRYNFVKSNHYNAYTSDNIYNNIAEAKSNTKETERLGAENGMIRTKVGTVGDKPFRFNNADVLSTQSGYFTEYPFTLNNYANQTNNVQGSFVTAEIKNIVDGSKGTYYVFTTDETRYNIAPTTATQHRFYAFYEMKVNIHLGEYSPNVEFKKLYDHTFYLKNGDKTDEPMFGAILTAEDPDGNAGMASAKACSDAITKAINDHKGDNNYPSATDQILYMDLSSMTGVFEDNTLTFKNYKEKSLAKNALVYLPMSSSSNEVNFATKTEAGFQAANNIEIIDKHPFFAPYDIQLNAANYAIYNREITNTEYDDIVNATIVLPFTIKAEGGVHTNPDNKGGLSFKLSQFKADESLVKVSGKNYGVGHFDPIDGDAKANKPYVVTLLNGAGENQFKVYSKGERVVATPYVQNSASNGVLDGESRSGSIDNTPYTLQHKGTYTGREVKNANKEKVFYFANNKFLNSATLGNNLSVYILPYRTFYEYTGNAPAKMQNFRISFEAIEDMGGTNGITDVQRDADLAVIPGDGSITLTARADKEVAIHAVNGQTVDKCNLRAGESRTVSVPAGVYVINGVKMVVK